MSQASEKVSFSSRAMAKQFVQITIVFAAYFIAGKLGQATTNIRSGNLGPVWSASGIALAAILIYGYRVWVGIAAAAFLIALWSPVPATAAAGQAAGASIAALTGAFLLRRVNFQSTLARLHDALTFIMLGAFGSALVSASIGTAVLFATHLHSYSGIGAAWLIYWLGDSTGALLITPLVLTAPKWLGPSFRERWTEFAALLLLLISFSILIFSDFFLSGLKLDVLSFALLAFVMWAAIRFGMCGAAVVTFAIAALGTIETAFGSGAFSHNTPFINAVLLDVFFTVLAVSGMALAAVIAEREHARREGERLVREQALARARSRLIEAQEDERRRIARELHDDIGQRLALLTVRLEQLRVSSPNLATEVQQQLNDLRQESLEMAADIQSLSHELHSAKLEYLGIASATEGYCREFAETQKVEVNCDIGELPEHIEPAISLCLFRVLQEALQNSVKHSRVGHFEVRMWAAPDQIHLLVSDAGAGFDRETVRQSCGLGLISMEERLKLLNGKLSIESQLNRGTTIHASLPLHPQDISKRAAADD